MRKDPLDTRVTDQQGEPEPWNMADISLRGPIGGTSPTEGGGQEKPADPPSLKVIIGPEDCYLGPSEEK